MTHYYLNEDHTYLPCSLEEWAAQMEQLWQTESKHVAIDEVEGKLVSTVWLGLDHNFKYEKASTEPLLFETMVFDSPIIGAEIYCKRYTTWEQAEAGHKKAIEWVKEGCKWD